MFINNVLNAIWGFLLSPKFHHKVKIPVHSETVIERNLSRFNVNKVCRFSLYFRFRKSRRSNVNIKPILTLSLGFRQFLLYSGVHLRWVSSVLRPQSWPRLHSILKCVSSPVLWGKKKCHLYGEKMKHSHSIVRVSFDSKRSSEKKS